MCKTPTPARVVAPYRIENATCPRLKCDGDVYHDPATNRVCCPACQARRVLLRLAGKAVRL